MKAKYDIDSLIYITENTHNSSLIYGETDHIHVESIIREYSMKYNISNFIDIGSGCGKLILHLSSNFPNINFEGIEIQRNRFEESLKNKKTYSNHELHVFFHHESFQHHYIGDYDFIYCCNTIFSEEDNLDLYKKLLREFKGLCVLFTQPSCLHHCFLETRHIGSSWCKEVTIYIYLFS